MITSAYLDTDRLDNAKRFLQAVNNLTFPSFSSSSAKKTSFEGIKLSVGKFQSYKFATEWMIVADDPSDLATQREDFAELLGQIFRDTSRTFKLTKDNSVAVQIDVKSASLKGDISSENYQHSKLLVEFEAEYPFLQSQTLQSENVNIFTGGGMSIPMAIPMDMSMGATNEVTLTNAGNYNAYPVLTLYGPLENPSLANLTTGKTLNITYTLPTSNDYIVIDTFTRTVLLYPGAVNVRQYVSGDFLTLQAGENILHLANTSYNGQAFCKVEFRDSYLGI